MYQISCNFKFENQISIPYVQGVSEPISRILTQVGIEVAVHVVQFVCHIINIYRVLKKLPSN